MAKVKMKRLEAVVFSKDEEPFLRALQRIGAVELSDDCDERLGRSSTKESVGELQKKIAITEEALSSLYEYAPPGGGLLGMLQGRTPTEEAEYDATAERCDEIFATAKLINSLRKEISDSKAEIVRAETTVSSLSVWKNLDIPLKYKGTAKTSAYIGTFPTLYTLDALNTLLAEKCPEDAAVCEIISSTKQQTAALIICHKSSAENIYKALRDTGFTHLSDTAVEDAGDKIAALIKDIEENKKKISETEKKIISLAEKRDDLQFLFDYLNVERDRAAASDNISHTKQTSIISGWVPEPIEKKVLNLAEKYGASVTFTEPNEEDEVPVLLKNNGFAQPVEAITEMYAMPGKKDIDPSSVMAFFYYLLFGMMLSDAGYGLVMVIGTALALKKTTVEGNLRRSLKMFFFCGISTIFWGALFGSWFGDIVPIICKEFFGITYTAGDMALWFEPIKDPIKLLLFSFVIGICHLFLGLITAGVMQWKEGKKWDAIFDTVPIMLLILGAAPLAAGVLVEMPSVVNTVAGYVAIAGLVLVVLTSSRSSKNIIVRLLGGLYGLYNIASGYLSDILSYSRLLALGLATGSIAGVINMLGVMPSNLVVKGILLAVVFVVGHALNMAINVLGAYVHTNRLQFVELFSKFYEGGGTAFNPLKMNTKYIKLKEEIKNE